MNNKENKVRTVHFKNEGKPQVKYFVKDEAMFPEINVNKLPIINKCTSILKEENVTYAPWSESPRIQRFIDNPKLWRSIHREELHIALMMGFNPNLSITDGNTLSHLYAQMGNVKYLKLLIHYKANVSLRNDAGHTPMDCCLLKFRELKHLESLKYRKCMKILFTAPSGPSVDTNEKFPKTKQLIENVLNNTTYIRSIKFREKLGRLRNILTMEQLKILLYFNLTSGFKIHGQSILDLYTKEGNHQAIWELLEFDPTLKINMALEIAQNKYEHATCRSEIRKFSVCLAFLESFND